MSIARREQHGYVMPCVPASYEYGTRGVARRRSSGGWPRRTPRRGRPRVPSTPGSRRSATSCTRPPCPSATTWGGAQDGRQPQEPRGYLCRMLDMVATEKGADVAGGRGYHLKDEGVLLNLALVIFSLI